MGQFYTLLQTNFIISPDILSTNFKVFNNPFMIFFCVCLLMFSNFLRTIKIETCHSYHKLCVKIYNFNISTFVGFIV